MPPDHSKAVARLKKACPTMKGLIDRVGPCAMEYETKRTPFQSLVSAVAHQQLHGKAAQTILGRYRNLFPGGRDPGPKTLANVSDDDLRGVGFSRSKTAALRDLAEKAISGVVPGRKEIETLSDEEIIARLTQVRGIGKWTVEMLLIFTLGRGDVWPVDDYGVRSGYQWAYGLDAMPKPKVLEELGEKFRPHRSHAAWYLWRATELAKVK
ncbi:DNA-3-methyladenine glycosylase 2 family protein [Luteolibacter ambystomatis]|uniref:DNA-3-methyladenine glycosylase II n=1 Tax=Luteolibacter ambystomatis TaxID=2824561 RepID=A0A975IYI8_9BACT|nr:DNA-3-methyladenine glycosylase [Luteolibacter ambystomatis]QUE49933.1 DNA-3-methyladenine glycosylase 2 family protein [Luteolibacter ambystomatis]